MKAAKKYISLGLICLGSGSIYALAYLRNSYYTPLMEVFGTDNTGMGIMMTFFAISQTLSFLPGGWLVDILPVKYILPIGLVGCSILGFIEATFPPFSVILLIQLGYGFFINMFFWDAMIKATRILAESDGTHGKTFGILESLRGLMSAGIAYLGLLFFNKAGEGISGLRHAIILMSTLALFSGILCFFRIEKNKTEGKISPRESLHNMVRILKMKRIWLAGGVIFFGYSYYNGLSVVAPMMGEIFGMSQTASSSANIFFQYVVKFVAAPVGGILADRSKSISHFLKWIMLVSVISTLLLLFIPYMPEYIVIFMIALTFTAICIAMMRGTYYSTTKELGIPLKAVGSAAGVMSIIGTLPDLFMFVIYGKMLDICPGSSGYKLVFLIMMLNAAGAAICASHLVKQNGVGVKVVKQNRPR